jgi:DNA-binding NarL/FixJ family response regulator
MVAACDARSELARAELVLAGGRPRRPASSGREALTATEERVARMAARGPTNREIAQTLVVTEKTVEAHLASCYRKLGIRSRGELAGRCRRARSRALSARPINGLRREEARA